MSGFPSIRPDFYQMNPSLSIGAALAVEPLENPGPKTDNSAHMALFHLPRLYIVQQLYFGSDDSSFYASYAMRIYSHFYKSRHITQIYTPEKIKEFGGEERLRHKHQFEVAKTVAILGISLIFRQFVYPIYAISGIINDVQFLAGAIKEKNTTAALEKSAAIAIRVFALVLLFNPNPIAKITLIALNVLQSGYYVHKAFNQKKADKHQLINAAPSIIALSYNVPKLCTALRAVI